MEGNFESFTSGLFLSVTVNVILCLHLLRKKPCRDPRADEQHPHRGCTTVKRACPPSSAPFLPGLKNYMLTGKTQLTLVEFNKRLGVICQVLHGGVYPLPHRKEFEQGLQQISSTGAVLPED
uniref:Uncharacterized protein n=1 Tax=Myotis myotis TaxID=51298 RepID=A0A7J8AN63_MYOMY|nr:hypothetical protein mMyoMyo1_008128 [Myotis myotis]